MLLFRFMFVSIGVFLMLVGRNNLRVARSRDERDWSAELEPKEERNLRKTTRVFGFLWIGIGIVFVVVALAATPTTTDS